MYDTVNHEERNADIYNYENDFQILTIKEKRGVLKNAKSLLKLQKENNKYTEILFFKKEK